MHAVGDIRKKLCRYFLCKKLNNDQFPITRMKKNICANLATIFQDSYSATVIHLWIHTTNQLTRQIQDKDYSNSNPTQISEGSAF